MTLISASSAFWRRVRFETTEMGCAEDSAHRLRFVGQTVADERICCEMVYH